MKYLDTSACIDGLYRYSLSRRLSTGERTVLFVGLNPSTADGTNDDSTIRRCVGFARDWGFDCLLMGNLYAYISTNPRVLPSVVDAVGSRNQFELVALMDRAELIVAAWGANRLDPVGRGIAEMVLSRPQTRCLGRNKNGSPKHPLRLRSDTALK